MSSWQEALARHDLESLMRVGAALFLFVMVGLEMGLRAVLHRRGPNVRDNATHAFIFAVDLLSRGALMGVRLAAFTALGALVPWSLEPTWWSLALAYVAVDFIYYWKHRLFHATKIGWALHQTHHSSRELNFLATFRLNWIESASSYFFFLPLALIGLPPFWLFVLIEINDGWQFLCHTELRNPLRLLDRVVNTPNIHRVHHARDVALRDKNFTSTFVIWDQLFGTYHPGLGQAEVGIEEERRGVFAIEFGALWNLLRRRV